LKIFFVRLQVEVEDELGRSKSVLQPFSLDGTRLSFSLLPRIALMINASVVVSFVLMIL